MRARGLRVRHRRGAAGPRAAAGREARAGHDPLAGQRPREPDRLAVPQPRRPGRIGGQDGARGAAARAGRVRTPVRHRRRRSARRRREPAGGAGLRRPLSGRPVPAAGDAGPRSRRPHRPRPAAPLRRGERRHPALPHDGQRRARLRPAARGGRGRQVQLLRDLLRRRDRGALHVAVPGPDGGDGARLAGGRRRLVQRAVRGDQRAARELRPLTRSLAALVQPPRGDLRARSGGSPGRLRRPGRAAQRGAGSGAERSVATARQRRRDARSLSRRPLQAATTGRRWPRP